MKLADRILSFLHIRQAHKRPTRFGMAYVYDTRWQHTSLRVLEVGGAYQSATFLDGRWCYPPFPYLRLFDKVFEGGRDIRSLCMLGGGGFAYPKHVIAHHAPTAIDVVEADQAVIDLAREFFFLDRLERVYRAQESGRLRIVCADGLAYLEACVQEGRRYDALLNDCFAGSVADSPLASPHAADLAHRCLLAGGLYLTNVISAFEGDRSAPLWDVANALGGAFAHVYACPASAGPATEARNVVVIATDEPLQTVGILPLIDASGSAQDPAVPATEGA